MLFFKVSHKTIQFHLPAQWSFTERFKVLTSSPLYTVSGQLGKTTTLSPHLLPNLPMLNVLNLVCCSSRSVIKLFNSSSLPSDLLLRALRSSLLPPSTLSLASLARQLLSHSTPYPISQSSMFSTYFVVLQGQLYNCSIPLPCPVIFYWELSDPHSYRTLHCLRSAWQDKPTLSSHHLPYLPILNVLNLLCCSSRSVIKLQFLFPAQWYFTESFQILTPTTFHTVLGQLGKKELLFHPTPYPISQSSNVLSLLCCFSRSVIKLSNSSSLPSDLLLRAFMSSLLPLSTLFLASLARQLLSHPTSYPISQCSMFST